PPISLWFGAGLPGGELAFLSPFSATSGTPHRHCLFLGDFHGYIMRFHSSARCSILTTVFNVNEGSRCSRLHRSTRWHFSSRRKVPRLKSLWDSSPRSDKLFASLVLYRK